jgi:hypothetical protein
MKNHVERAPGTVELDELECHALQLAFMNNPEALAQLTVIASEKDMKLWSNELKGTTHLVFAPNEEMKMVYAQIAEAEIKRLAAEKDPVFHCGHSPADHQRALQLVESMFSQPSN